MKPRMSATPANVSSGSMNESTPAAPAARPKPTSTHRAQPPREYRDHELLERGRDEHEAESTPTVLIDA